MRLPSAQHSNEKNFTNNTIINMSNISTSTRILSIAVVLIVSGYLLMAGPGSTEQQFNPDVFSTRRIVVAPTLCLAGYLLIIVGILSKK